MRFRVVTATALVALAAGGMSACDSEDNQFANAGGVLERGSELFVERCAGCHTLDAVGANGGAVSVNDRERVDGPNFNVRPEDLDTVLYAIRNGGFGGGIMPENIVVGEDAMAVARFLTEIAGYKRENRDVLGGTDGSDLSPAP